MTILKFERLYYTTRAQQLDTMSTAEFQSDRMEACRSALLALHRTGRFIDAVMQFVFCISSQSPLLHLLPNGGMSQRRRCLPLGCLWL